MRQIHLLSRDCGSCLGPVAYNELAGMMSKALEQLQLFKEQGERGCGCCGGRLLCRMLPVNFCVARLGV